MKNWKKGLGVLLLTIAYVCFAEWTFVAYYQWALAAKQRASHGHPELIPYIDVTFYGDTIYGKAAGVGGVVVAIIDMIALASILGSKTKTAAVATLSIILLPLFAISFSLSTPAFNTASGEQVVANTNIIPSHLRTHC